MAGGRWRPHSDIDLMFLFHPDAAKVIPELVKQVLHPLWDSGFQVGHSVRTIQDCVDLGLADLTVRTSMMEARFLAGSAELFQQFHARYVRKVVSRRCDAYLEQKVAERQREYQKFGETVYLLEPNVKKSQGGLRDLHLLQWSGWRGIRRPRFVNCPTAGFCSSRLLSHQGGAGILLRIRSFLHIRAGMAQEILTFDEQVWLATQLGSTRSTASSRGRAVFSRSSTIAIRWGSTPLRCDLWNAAVAAHCGNDSFDGCRRHEYFHQYFVVDGQSLTVPVELRSQVLDRPATLLEAL